jgi:hypothetical protein
VSIQDIQQNPQDTSNFYLANIYQILADSNRSNISTSLPASPPPFTPPSYAVWVNALWFLSLVISLTCALLATFLQQWARRYLKITQSRYSPHKRARIRAFFAEGVEKCLLTWAVETLPTLLHLSLFLFFAGLVVFLSNVHPTIFTLVFSWVGLCMALYGCITCMPIIRHDSPYYTSLSLPAWHMVIGMLFFVYRFLQWFNGSLRFRYGAFRHFQHLKERCLKLLVQGMQKTAEETALNSPSEIYARAFMWTFDCLDEDHELEHFFSGLPGFRSSNVVNDPLPSLTEEQKRKLYEALRGLLNRTFSSDFLPAPLKNRRAMICAKAVDPEHTPDPFSVINIILSKYQHSGPLATGIANVLRGWRTRIYGNDILIAQAIISEIIARSRPHDDSWFILASKELGTSGAHLQYYAAHGNSLSLATLIHVVRQHFSHFRDASRSWPPSWPYGFWKVLGGASKFSAEDTLPELQHGFCALWNQIVREIQNGDDGDMAYRILAEIRNIYLALHQGTDSAPTRFSASTGDRDRILMTPTSYPLCNVPGHHSDSTPNIHAGTGSGTSARAVSHVSERITPVTSFLSGSPDPPSASALSPLRVLAPLDENTFISDQARTTTEFRSDSSDRIPTGATQCSLYISPRMTYLLTPEPRASPIPTKSNRSTPPPGAIAVDSHTPSRDAKVPSSPLPTLILDNMLPIGMLFPLDSAAARTDHIPLSPESQHPTPASAASSPSRSWGGASESAEEEDGAKDILSQGMEDVLHDNTTVTPDVSSQPSPSQPIVDVAITGLCP